MLLVLAKGWTVATLLFVLDLKVPTELPQLIGSGMLFQSSTVLGESNVDVCVCVCASHFIHLK